MYLSSSNQGEEVWLRKVANGKEENLMAFQGRKNLIRSNSLKKCPDTHSQISAADKINQLKSHCHPESFASKLQFQTV